MAERLEETCEEVAVDGAEGVGDTRPLGLRAPAARRLDGFVSALGDDADLGPQVVHHTYLEPTRARFVDLDPPLAEPLARALERNGVEQLWSHQAEGIDAVRRGENVLVTTPTASGKSLVFQLPVLEEAARGGAGKALFLFPLKALGQDQKTKFDLLARAAELPPEEVRCEIYDGDTPTADRTAIRRAFPRVVISNPDMLHLAVLSYWSGWEPFLRDLRWVVLDELHTYRGIFGSHFHHVLQRFLRLVREAQGGGGEPRLIASSATAENAVEFAQALTGRSFTWIRDSGAPREGRHVVLLRPEASPYTAALKLFSVCLEAGLKTIVFTKARRITELLYSWLRRQEPEKARKVASYRAGFLPEERRKIERRLFEGNLDGVISTSALEMGIDVGGLDACILVGYPGSMMATWQRSGRVGRADRESLTALVAMPDALDQYFLDHPEELLQRPCEPLIVDPDNEPVTRAHLICAASELALGRLRDRDYLDRHGALVDDLLRDRRILQSAEGDELYSVRRRPQRDISLRGTGATYTIHDEKSERVIGTVDGVRALHECHPGAVYLHFGRQYVVKELDLEERCARASRARVDYFTTPLASKETEILEILDHREDGPLEAWLGKLKVTERVTGFERKRIQGQEVIDQQPLELPPTHFETVGVWWAAPPPIEETIRKAGEHFLGALHATEHAAISLFPLLALCDRGDIGGISLPFHPQVGSGAVFVYDGHPGGVGIAARGFTELPALLDRVLALLDACPCEDGCPSCIQSPKCGNGNRPLDKAGAARVLRLLLDREKPVPTERKKREPILPIPPEEIAPENPPSVPPALGVEGEDGPSAASSTKSGASPPIHRVAGVAGVAEPAVEESVRPRRKHKRKKRRKEGYGPSVQNTVLFDLETLRSAEEVGGWDKIHKMGLAVGVTCHLEEGRFDVFTEDRVEELVERLTAADLVVGFNVKRFDYQVLAGYTGIDYNRKLQTLDLLEEVHRFLGFRVKLESLTRSTLGVEKSADGLQSLEWVREGRLDLVEEYCRKDVEILRDLYLFGRREGYVLYPDRERGVDLRVAVEW